MAKKERNHNIHCNPQLFGWHGCIYLMLSLDLEDGFLENFFEIYL